MNTISFYITRSEKGLKVDLRTTPLIISLDFFLLFSYISSTLVNKYFYIRLHVSIIVNIQFMIMLHIVIIVLICFNAYSTTLYDVLQYNC